MLARLSAGLHDGRRHQADEDFEGWAKTIVLFLAISGLKFMKFWRQPFVVFNSLSQLPISSSVLEIFALKVAT